MNCFMVWAYLLDSITIKLERMGVDKQVLHRLVPFKTLKMSLCKQTENGDLTEEILHF